MKHFRSALAALLILLTFAPSVGAQEKKSLTNAEILGNMPKGIVGQPAIPMAFDDNRTLIYREGQEFFRYDLRKGTAEPFSYTPPRGTSRFEELVPGWKNPTFSPDSTKIAYTLDNDLYSINVKSKKIIRHTFDGSELNLNGYASWVYYEEIFGRGSNYRAFWWSPDSKVIAYYNFDNSQVPMFPIYNSQGQHGSLTQTRYPKAGDSNPKVRIGFVSANGGETVWSDFDPEPDQYFGIPFWSGDGKRFMVARMDRAQDNLELFSVDPILGNFVCVYAEHQESWIDWMEEMLFTPEGIYIVRDFEGWEQIYFLSYDGNRFEKLTGGRNWGISLLKVDSKYLFFTAKREATTRVDVYRVTLRSQKTERVSFDNYNFANVIISPDSRNVAAVVSNAQTPYFLVNISLPTGNLNRKKVTVISDSKGPDFDKYDIALPEIITIKTRDGLDIPASVIWPVNLDKSKKYPVKVNIYGGPNSPQVRDRWSGVSFSNQWWANNGVIQVTLDNRAGGHFGKKGLEQVYRRLSIPELRDFIDGIKHFLAMPFVDADKIGIEGFSYGGMMTVLCVTEGSDYFKYGIAGAGVYDWHLYDSHYTERYMDRPQDNPKGYEETNVLGRLSNYKGDKTNMIRLTHGTGDDNVHFQNTLQLIDVLQKQNKDFELMIYPEAMHGYRGAQGRHSAMQDYIFWYRYLLDSELPSDLLEYFKK
ncbi:MAG TPA: DPP IV N-terminal domain-containing protein [Bacteroidales bacterium]|nr:DPP IV N-terminal domain-containing protein [Bacteroidales bacterium]